MVYTVNNPLQREQMDGLRTEVLIYLKTNLKNAAFELHLEMREQASRRAQGVFLGQGPLRFDGGEEPCAGQLRKALDLDLG